MIDPAYLNAYIDRLKSHDWHYERSDDHRVFKAGLAARHALEREADLDNTGALRQLYQAVRSQHFAALDRIDVELSHSEHIDLLLRRATGNATARPTDAQRLAKIVHTLAVALARADPDNRAPQRALDALNTMGLLEATLTTPLPEKPR